MSNSLGNNIVKYNNVIIKDSTIGDNAIFGDDVFVSNSSVGRFCRIERRSMIFNSTIGDYSYTGFNTVVKNCSIGKYCSISWNVSIGGADHDYKHMTTHPFPIDSAYGFTKESIPYDSFSIPLSIGNDVWIGSNAVITRGRRIGDGAVIGAGAVVTHDVPPYEIWAGVPARKISQRFSDRLIELIMDLEWWNLPEEKLKRVIHLFRENATEKTVYDMISKLKDKE